jgi:hypothetical protein
MVELRLKSGVKSKALEAFEQRGPNRTPGVTLRGAWVADRKDLVFALLESADEALIAKAASSWGEFGDSQITSVHDIEQL